MHGEKRIALKLLACAALFPSLGHAASVPAGEITIWAWARDFNIAIMKEAGARYTARHPEIRFKLVEKTKPELEHGLSALLNAGKTLDLPDIVLVEDYYAQMYLLRYPLAFEALSGKIDYARFAKYKVDLMKANGRIYGVPFDSGVTGLFYRRDLLAKAGFAPQDLENISWDRFIEIGRKVLAATGKKMMALAPDDLTLIHLMMQSAGRWYFAADGPFDIKGNPALKAALETEVKLMQSGIVKPVMKWDDYMSALSDGDVATITTGVWFTAVLKADKRMAGRWGVAPTPSLSVAGAVNASNLGGSSWYVLATSPQKAEAIDFLNEIYGKDIDFYQRILQDRGAMGSLLAARTGKAYMEGDAFFGGDKVWQRFSDWLAKVPSVNYGMFTAEADAALAAQMPLLFKGAPPEQVMNRVEQQVLGQMK